MKNPRFEDDSVAPLQFPDIEKINCRDCHWREADRLNGQIKGATLAMCKVYNNVYPGKPYAILWKNDPCPYYICEKDMEESP